MSKNKQIPRAVLERTVQEQEQSILQLRSRNSELEAKLAAKSRRARKTSQRKAAARG